MQKISGKQRVSLIIIDLLVIIVSLFAAWVIRSQFNFFTYDIRKFSYLFPWVLITRTVCHLFFELYSLSMTSFGSRDITRIFKFNLIPTALLLFLRFFPYVSDLLSMPLSMIAMEYVFSTIGFVFIRLVFHSRTLKSDKIVGHIKRIIVWAEIFDFEKLVNLEQIRKNGIEILGIINSNPLFWNKEYKGIRVYGGSSELPRISAEDDRICAVCILKPDELTKRQKKDLCLRATSLNMEIGYIEGNKYISKDKDFLDRED